MRFRSKLVSAALGLALLAGTAVAQFKQGLTQAEINDLTKDLKSL